MEDTIDEDEKKEMILDIVSSIIDSKDAESIVTKIFDKWNESHGAPKKSVEVKQEEVDIAELLKTTTKISLEKSSKSAHRELTEEEKRIKQQILANYSQTSDKEEDDEEEIGDESDDDFEKNTNKADVQKLAREKREQAKKESEEKKLKDKEDRAKQKALREEKKSKRQGAAVKGERRR